jgi:hypothetical protein
MSAPGATHKLCLQSTAYLYIFFEKGSFSDFKIVTSRQYINLKSSWPLLGRHTTLHKNANKRDTLMANGYQFEDHSADDFLVDS